MTQRVGPGTVNFAINMAEEERKAWGKVAFDEDESTGELIKRLALRALAFELPGAAAEIADIRRRRKAAVLLAVCLLAVMETFFPGRHNDQLVRARRAVRVCRVEIEEATT